jgi:hypothetical protein
MSPKAERRVKCCLVNQYGLKYPKTLSKSLSDQGETPAATVVHGTLKEMLNNIILTLLHTTTPHTTLLWLLYKDYYTTPLRDTHNTNVTPYYSPHTTILYIRYYYTGYSIRYIYYYTPTGYT